MASLLLNAARQEPGQLYMRPGRKFANPCKTTAQKQSMVVARVTMPLPQRNFCFVNRRFLVTKGL